jgi:hypothetical protein
MPCRSEFSLPAPRNSFASCLSQNFFAYTLLSPLQVYRLPIHLENQEVVEFDDAAPLQQVLAQQPITQLTAWFRRNQQDEAARQVTYQDFPSHFTWDADNKAWKPRHGYGNVRLQVPPIGRMYFVPPSQGTPPSALYHVVALNELYICFPATLAQANFNSQISFCLSFTVRRALLSPTPADACQGGNIVSRASYGQWAHLPHLPRSCSATRPSSR